MSTPTPTWVDSPPPIEPRPYGLFSAASLTEGAGKWQVRGVEYFTDACAQGGFVVGSCPQPATNGSVQLAASVGGADTARAIRIVPATPATTTLVQVVADADLPHGYETTWTPPGGGTPATATLAPGAHLNKSGTVAGDYELTVTDAPCDLTITSPFAAGQTQLAACPLAYPVTWTLGLASTTPVILTITQASAPVQTVTLNPGETAAAQIYTTGDYDVSVAIPGSTDLPVPWEVTVAEGAQVSTQLAIFNRGGTSHDKPITEGLNLVDASAPFTIYARAECNAVGFDDPQGLALRRLALIEEREAERFFSQYVLGRNDPDHAPGFPAGMTPLPLLEAIGVLEQDAALHYNGTPTLHANRWANPYFNAVRTLQEPADTGRVLRTNLGSVVVFGGGYYLNPFTPSEPPDEGQFWLVATGAVRGWRVAPFVNETFTPATNTRLAIAERTYLFDADCYRAAVLVDTTGGA